MVVVFNLFFMSQVYLLPAARMELFNGGMIEYASGNELLVHVRMTALLPETSEEVSFSDCTAVPFTITSSDETNFQIGKRAGTSRFA